jgi:uncharacterized protein
MNFKNELKKGNFIVSECNNCKKIIWPPSEFCNQCFKETSWRRGPKEGTIIEFSKHNNSYFCLAEFENTIKIMGKMSSGMPNTGKKVKIEKCGMRNEICYFELSLIQ